MNKHILLNNVQVSNYKPVPMWKYNYKLLMNKLPTLPRAGHPKPTSAESDQDVFRLKQTNPIVKVGFNASPAEVNLVSNNY